MIYKILETDKCSDKTRMLAYFAEKDAAIATAEVSDPPLPRVVILLSLLIP